MTVIDLQDQREARRRARFEEFCAEQDRKLADADRLIAELRPLTEEWLEYQKQERARRPRAPMCEAPRCRDTLTTLHAIPRASPEDPHALIALCDNHLYAVQGGRVRVRANRDDTLTWWFCPVGVARVQLTVRRKRGRRART